VRIVSRKKTQTEMQAAAPIASVLFLAAFFLPNARYPMDPPADRLRFDANPFVQAASSLRMAGHLLIVRCDDQRFARLGIEPREQDQDLLRCLCVEFSRWLVGENQLRIHYHRAGDGGSLLLLA
jgi:hypothetical protein